MRKPELLRTIARIGSLLERGETHIARILADEVFEAVDTTQLEHEQLLTLTAPYAFQHETVDEGFVRFTETWMRSLLNLHARFNLTNYLDKVLWISRLLIRNGLSNRAFDLMNILQAELVEHLPEKFSKLLEEHSTFPGFERYYPLLVPEMRLKA